MSSFDSLNRMQSNPTPKNSIKAIKNSAIDKVPEYWVKDWLLYVINKPHAFLITDDDYQLTDDECAQFNAGLAKMQQGTPLAYLTGSQAFWSLDFKVNEHTLIPRPDTEVLVEQVLKWIQAQPQREDKPKRLLDLGTGSGCIAISLADELKSAHWQVVAVDISPDALDVARHNATVNNVTHIEFITSRWYDRLSTQMDCLFDIIVSNPPYIDAEDAHLAHLQAEPLSALSAGNQGLADIAHIVQYAPQYLQVGGLLAIEHGFEQGLAVRQLFATHGFESIATIQDYGANDRVTLGQL